MSTGINIAPSSDLTVGTTAVTSGTDGRVFFQAGGVVQQDANFTYDNTLKRLGLKAVGTAGTDIPLSISNSAGTVNLLQQTGVGSILARSNDTFSFAGLFYRSDGTNGWSLTNSHSGYGQGTGIETVGGNNYILSSGTRALSIQRQSTGTFKTYGIWNYGSDSGQRLLIGENVFDPQFTLSGTGNVGIGTYSGGARLDVRAQGALSTDIAFRVRNSADTYNTMAVRGNGVIDFQNPTLGSTFLTIGQVGAGNSADCFLDFSGSRGIRNRQGGVVQTGIRIFYNSTSRNIGTYISATENSGDNTIFIDGGNNIRIGQGNSNTNQPDASATRTIQQMTGVAPTTSVADGFQQYSADITAGNAAPHFRTENGAIVKVYQETTAVTAAAFVANTSAIVDDTATYGGYTMGQVVAALKAQGLLA
jgi:hypothetical protein